MKTITVKGEGSVSVKPDLIVVSMTLETKDKDYDKILNLAAEKIDEINKSLEEIGFDKNSIKTSHFGVSTEYESVKDKNGQYKRVFKGYCCEHFLNVEFDFDTKRLAKVLSAISACLAKPQFSISFRVKDATVVNQKLLEAAAKNALEKAKILCAASNVKLGELVSISYNWGEINVCSDTNYKMEGAQVGAAKAFMTNIDIVPDDVKFDDSATFVWEIL